MPRNALMLRSVAEVEEPFRTCAKTLGALGRSKEVAALLCLLLDLRVAVRRIFVKSIAIFEPHVVSGLSKVNWN